MFCIIWHETGTGKRSSNRYHTQAEAEARYGWLTENALGFSLISPDGEYLASWNLSGGWLLN